MLVVLIPLSLLLAKDLLNDLKILQKTRPLTLIKLTEANAFTSPSLIGRQEDREQFDSCTYQISSEEQDAKELQEEVLGEQ